MKQKPIECDVHFKYICDNCGQAHWLSLDETKTKGFKIVCICKKIFSVKRIRDIKVLYAKRIKHSPEVKLAEKTEEPQRLNKQLLDRACSILVGYGFTKKEAIEAVEKTYSAEQIGDHLELVKKTLASMRT